MSIMKEKILIADDEEDILELLRFNLAKEGYQILCAKCGQDALNIVSKELPELILLDIMMPNMDGYAVCRFLKGDSKHKNVPVIFLTAMQETDNKIKGFEAGAVDYITKPFAIPEVIARVKNHLAIKSFYKGGEQAENNTKAKSEFLAIISHEIRSPIQAIIGMTHLAMKTEDTAKQQEYLSVMSTASGSLLYLINDILDYSKFEAGKIRIDKIMFDIRKIVEEMEDLVSANAHNKGLELASLIEPNVPDLFRGDSNRLKQILLNFVGNSIKFTSNGEVFVRISLVSETSTHATVKFTITDTGIGIPEKYLDNLFKPFSQAHGSTTRNYGGTGLGLMISKQLVEMMGGEVGLESKEGKGTTFWFTVVFEKQIRKENNLPKLDNNISNKAILIIDDNANHIESISNHLKYFGCRYNTANQINEALILLKQSVKENDPFHLIVFDKNMISTEDIKKISAIIQNDPILNRTSLVPLIPFGSKYDLDNDWMKEADYFACLTKPVKRAKLLDCIVSSFDFTPDRNCLKILLVETNFFNKKLVLSLLHMHTIKVINNYREAYNILQKEKFDLILIDLQSYDEVKSIELITNIKNYLLNLNTQIIAFTSYDVKDKALSSLLKYYIAKPINPKKLFELIKIISGEKIRNNFYV
ncbi:MAG: response regulator [Desulfobacterales bacterium]|nr:response regulator [Desulfobacterales bacterium]MBF0396408.1 response regulator [Desulfobacterales bacterium]